MRRGIVLGLLGALLFRCLVEPRLRAFWRHYEPNASARPPIVYWNLGRSA